MHTYLRSCLPTDLSTDPSFPVYLSIYLLTYLPICLTIYRTIHRFSIYILYKPIIQRSCVQPYLQICHNVRANG